MVVRNITASWCNAQAAVGKSVPVGVVDLQLTLGVDEIFSCRKKNRERRMALMY